MSVFSTSRDLPVTPAAVFAAIQDPGRRRMTPQRTEANTSLQRQPL